MDQNQNQDQDNHQHHSNHSSIPPVAPAAGSNNPMTREERIREWRKRHTVRTVIGILVALVIAAIIFLSGMIVGRTQDRFAFQRISRNSGYMMQSGRAGMNAGMGGGMSMGSSFGTPGMLGGQGAQRNEANANGAEGTISAINSDNVTVQGNNGVSTVVSITAVTVIHSNGQDIKISDLKTGETVTVIGDPDQSGQIVARYINVQAN